MFTVHQKILEQSLKTCYKLLIKKGNLCCELLGFLSLTLSKYLFNGQDILGLEISSRQTHAQSQQQKS